MARDVPCNGHQYIDEEVCPDTEPKKYSQRWHQNTKDNDQQKKKVALIRATIVVSMSQAC